MASKKKDMLLESGSVCHDSLRHYIESLFKTGSEDESKRFKKDLKFAMEDVVGLDSPVLPTATLSNDGFVVLENRFKIMAAESEIVYELGRDAVYRGGHCYKEGSKFLKMDYVSIDELNNSVCVIDLKFSKSKLSYRKIREYGYDAQVQTYCYLLEDVFAHEVNVLPVIINYSEDGVCVFDDPESDEFREKETSVPIYLTKLKVWRGCDDVSKIQTFNGGSLSGFKNMFGLLPKDFFTHTPIDLSNHICQRLKRDIEQIVDLSKKEEDKIESLNSIELINEFLMNNDDLYHRNSLKYISEAMEYLSFRNFSADYQLAYDERREKETIRQKQEREERESKLRWEREHDTFGFYGDYPEVPW